MSGQSIPQQLSKIEQRQCCIHAIRGKLNANSSPHQIEPEDMAADPGVRYNMGISQKFPVHIPTFLQRNAGDPAIRVSGSFTFACALSSSGIEFLLKVMRSPTALSSSRASARS